MNRSLIDIKKNKAIAMMHKKSPPSEDIYFIEIKGLFKYHLTLFMGFPDPPPPLILTFFSSYLYRSVN